MEIKRAGNMTAADRQLIVEPELAAKYRHILENKKLIHRPT